MRGLQEAPRNLRDHHELCSDLTWMIRLYGSSVMSAHQRSCLTLSQTDTVEVWLARHWTARRRIAIQKPPAKSSEPPFQRLRCCQRVGTLSLPENRRVSDQWHIAQSLVWT